ncbi:MAG: glutaredoxin family protein [Candidatus Heimdallarchaeaceae archaeon]
MNFSDIQIPGDIVIINGTKNDKDIFMFALSTCQWCKKGKQWLLENDYSYRYVDVDLLPLIEKRDLKTQLRRLFNTMIRYPFLVINGKDFFAGYNIEEWEKLLV